MTEYRYCIQNLGKPGIAGQSLFSIAGIPFASRLIDDGWVPCGMFINEDGEIIQSFYFPKEPK